MSVMKIIVPVSIVPDIYYPVENHISHGGISVTDEYLDINPLDKQTLSSAMTLTDDVEVIHIGESPREKALRYIMGMGVKNLTHIKASSLDAYSTAYHLYTHIEKKEYDIIMCSNSSWDYASGQTPEYLSQLLGVPIIKDVSHIEKDSKGHIHITCSHSDFIEHHDDIHTPVILSCDKSIFPAESVKIPSMRDMMMSMRMPINTITSSANPQPHTTYSDYHPASPRPKVKMLSLDEMDVIIDIIGGNDFSSSRQREDSVTLFSGRVEASMSSSISPQPIPYPHTGRIETLPAHNDIKDASIIISGGMGCTADDWKMIDDIAADINAAVGCTRPVFHSGTRPYYQHIGQTGTRVAPQVYLALGISGALQHIGGMMHSGVVIAVNTDPHAAIFTYSDYGIVAPASTFLKVLKESLTHKT